MSKATPDASEFWTEADYLALDETPDRVELVDGSLWVTPSANHPHQRISGHLFTMLWRAAEDADQELLHAPNLRLQTNRILVPDFAAGTLSELGVLSEAADVSLVCEITSPSNATVDRGKKMEFYAAAGIPWYLLVEPDHVTYDEVTLHLYRLHGDHYLEHAMAKTGATLTLVEPFSATIDTVELLRRPRRNR